MQCSASVCLLSLCACYSEYDVHPFMLPSKPTGVVITTLNCLPNLCWPPTDWSVTLGWTGFTWTNTKLIGLIHKLQRK
jgi:hypothetical protein